MSDSKRNSHNGVIVSGPEFADGYELRRPLAPGAKFLLACSSTLSILLCYVFALVSLVGLLVLLLLEAVLFLILLRFGLAGFLLDAIVRHVLLGKIFIQNLWLPKGVDFRLSLPRKDATNLFAMLDELARHFQIRPPDEVKVEMNCGAWVELRGFRKGAGKTILGIGFDLMASLTVSEFQAVLAHEMAHAKLVERGLKSWLNRGLGRIAQLSGALSQFAEVCRAQNGKPGEIAFFRDTADKITRVAARQVSAYSRQDEFEADSGAAQVCGGQPLRTSLQRLEVIIPRLDRIPWSERVGRATTEPSFSEWLKGELAPQSDEAVASVEDEVHDPYSTHPALADRLRALPQTPATFPNDNSAVSLLTHPDKVAEALFEELHRVLAVQEEKDWKLLDRHFRKVAGTMPFGLGHIPSVVLFIGGLVAALGFLLDGRTWWFIVVAVLLFAASRWTLRFARYRDRWQLPVPRFADLKKASDEVVPLDIESKEAALKEEYKAGGKGKKPKLRFGELIGDAYQALGAGDYLRAHVASGAALQIDDKSVEGALAQAVASARFRMDQHVGGLFSFINAKSAFTSLQTCWGAAWACIFMQDWVNAEAFLKRIQQKNHQEATFLFLLALVQWKRGKLQAAIRNAESACLLDPQDFEGAKLRCQCLMAAGRVREAAERLEPLLRQTESDPEISLMMMTLSVQGRDLDGTERWATRCRSHDAAPKWLVSIGRVFEGARLDEQAFGYFEQAVKQGYYPEAYLGLGRILHRKRDSAAAREHMLFAMNLSRELGAGAYSAEVCFPLILAELMQIDRKRCYCKAWIAAFKTQDISLTPPKMRGCRLLVFAPTREQAAAYVDEVLTAVQPNSPVVGAADLVWNEVPQNPERPVFPGVQNVITEG